MTIEIHQPELESLISQQMASGRFQDVEDVLLHALRSAPILKPAPNRSLVEVCAMVRGLMDDVDFSRNASTDRPLELA
jgi:hypothetical protein